MIPKVWTFLARYPDVEIVHISIEDNYAKRPKINMSCSCGFLLQEQRKNSNKRAKKQI